MKTKLISFALGLLTCSLTSFAQQSSISSGGDASGSGGTVAYSVGQVVYTANTTPEGTVARGVQQPYEIFEITGIDDMKLSSSISVFPNPVSNILILEMDDFPASELTYQLFDLQGKLLISNEINDRQTQIDITELPLASYILRVVKDRKNIQSFKIIKNQ
ncbi:MAG: T9SS type A sorting domain-containing protein [Chitinophagales bacterium]